MADEYQRSDERGRHRLLGLRNRNQAFNPQTRLNLFPFVALSTGRVSHDTERRVQRGGASGCPDGTQTLRWTWGRERE